MAEGKYGGHLFPLEPKKCVILASLSNLWFIEKLNDVKQV